MTYETKALRASVKSLDFADETQSFPHGRADTVRLGELVVGRIMCEPGWHWKEQIRPIAGSESCQFHHVGVGLSGELRFLMDDGSQFSVKGGDVFDIPPGHDVWVVGDDPSVSIMWVGWRGFGKPPVANRVVLTLVFTDIVGSTEHLARVGDAAWDHLLDTHNSSVREILEEYHGREIGTTGDGFLIAFDGAARALAATLAIRDALTQIGLEMRASIHTGEVESAPAGLRGLAVHEAARILALAGPGEILVSNTTRDLASGIEVDLEDRGLHRLRGAPGERHIFALAT